MGDGGRDGNGNDGIQKITSDRLAVLTKTGNFQRRHIGLSDAGQGEMLAALGLSSTEELIAKTIPQDIWLGRSLNLAPPKTETEALGELRAIANQNQVWRSYIGTGYYPCITPPVIQRNILENPGWYTAYTPYQAEIAQGRLEMLLNFQTMVADLTGMDIANASLLDEGTAAAEAMSLAYGACKVKGANRFLVDRQCHPQVLEVLKTRARPLDIELVIGDWREFVEGDFGASDGTSPVFGVYVQYPNTAGTIEDYRSLVTATHNAKALMIVGADLLALTLLTPPGDWDADVVVGSSQRFGVPLGYGGPHAAYFATRDRYKRQIPGRIVGVSQDGQGKPALRLALQTREQHIRRDKATSNICTAQVLLAVMAAAYGIYHGPEGLRAIANRVRLMTLAVREGLAKLSYEVAPRPVFDCARFRVTENSPYTSVELLRAAMEAQSIDLHYLPDGAIAISLDETVTLETWAELMGVLAKSSELPWTFDKLLDAQNLALAESFERKTEYLTQPVFNQYHSETELMRYLHRLEKKDLALNESMIPLGSCTMKLNAAVEMIPVTWPEFANIHPYAPRDRAQGYQIMCRQLEHDLAEITGFTGISLQPNAGSQGEYAGLLAIRDYHLSRGDGDRTICLIPTSAHGTNPASAVMAGMKVVTVKCDDQGNIDLGDLEEKATKHSANLAALMVTYPSTHGVFETTIKSICSLIHSYGGQVYMDGANTNAMVGLCRPADFGADVCHLNLHKTFCIPHGGGGPGVGPIGVASHLVPFLPKTELGESDNQSGMVSAAPWGSASILPISWMYIKMMGAEGLTAATEAAILNANYVALRLDDHFPVLYRGESGLVAHECIIDLREVKRLHGIEVDDIAKRLMDYGFHAPTVSWPVLGTMMVEPTESESKGELDRFCDALIAIRQEIEAIATGKFTAEDNPLKHAPHTAEVLLQSNWDRPYSREEAAYPAPWTRESKFWPTVGRVDNAYGDRNLMCSCAPLSDYED
ncbi:MAG: aminomethyl-transferring glycine dehydrogenase [Cyanophyceae cyanobacterium]